MPPNKIMDNCLHWVILNDSTTEDIGKDDIIPVPQIFLPKLFERAKYWSKHYPGGKVFLVFDMLDTDLLTKKQIDNVNSAMQGIVDACEEFKQIVVVNFANLKKYIIDNTSNAEELARKNSYFEILDRRRIGLKNALVRRKNKEIIDVRSYRGTFIDLERYTVIDNFPQLRKMQGMDEDECNRAVLYTDIDIILNATIDHASISETLLGNSLVSIRGYPENSAIFAQFTKNGQNELMKKILQKCADREENYKKAGKEEYREFLNYFDHVGYRMYNYYWECFYEILEENKTENFRVAFERHVMSDTIIHIGENESIIKAYANKAALAYYASGSHKVELSESDTEMLRDVLLHFTPPIVLSDMENPISFLRNFLKEVKESSPKTLASHLTTFFGIISTNDLKKFNDDKQKSDEEKNKLRTLLKKMNIDIDTVKDLEDLNEPPPLSISSIITYYTSNNYQNITDRDLEIIDTIVKKYDEALSEKVLAQKSKNSTSGSSNDTKNTDQSEAMEEPKTNVFKASSASKITNDAQLSIKKK